MKNLKVKNRSLGNGCSLEVGVLKATNLNVNFEARSASLYSSSRFTASEVSCCYCMVARPSLANVVRSSCEISLVLDCSCCRWPKSWFLN